MRLWVGLLLILSSSAVASDFSRVDQDLKTYDDHVIAMNVEFDKSPALPADKEWVKSKLAHMVDVDQYARGYFAIPSQHGYTDAEKQRFWKVFPSRLDAVDEKDTSDLQALLKIYRWFTISEFGKVADKNAWLLVQHADRNPEFQRTVLSILSSLWQKGETSPQNFAYLYDRLAADFYDPSHRKPQRYGTQGLCGGRNVWQMLPVEDPAHLDERRTQVGLGSESDYVKIVRQFCY